MRLFVVISFLLLYSLPIMAMELIQNTQGREHLSLDGDWHIIVDPYENGFYDHRYRESANGYFRNAKPKALSDLIEYDFSASPKITVPGDWNSQKEKLFFYEGTVWYYKNFTVEKIKEKRYVLHFGAVNYSAIVYVNGEKVGQHEGGFTPFQFDVSDNLKSGKNFVVVKVDNTRARDNIPTVNTDWWNYGGLTRSVKLLALDRQYLSDYSLQLSNDDNREIVGWVKVTNASLTHEVVTLKVPELGINKTITLGEAGYTTFKFSAQPTLWSPENPKLYNVEFVYNGTTLADKIGFRHIRVEGENVFLNDKSIYFRGISLHEEAPNREGRAWSEYDARISLTRAKALGANFIRLAHYPHNENIIRMADELGLMVWSEIPVYWTIQFENPQVYTKAEQQLSEMISRDKNRASVVLWSVANETPNHQDRYDFLKKLISKARELDNSRLITAASDTQAVEGRLRKIDDPLAGLVDVIGINTYCGWYSDKPKTCPSLRWQSDYNKPVIISEFGAGAKHGLHGDTDERWTEEYQADVYKYNLAMIDKMPFVRGTTPWILVDFRSPRRPLPAIQDYWNRKGLLSETGEKKLAWFVLHDYYAAKAQMDSP